MIIKIFHKVGINQEILVIVCLSIIFKHQTIQRIFSHLHILQSYVCIKFQYYQKTHSESICENILNLSKFSAEIKSSSKFEYFEKFRFLSRRETTLKIMILELVDNDMDDIKLFIDSHDDDPLMVL